MVRVVGTPVVDDDGDKDDTLTATATCPANHTVTGGGGTAVPESGQFSKVHLIESYPSSTTVWTTKAAVQGDLSAGTDDFTLTAYAMCVQTS